MILRTTRIHPVNRVDFLLVFQLHGKRKRPTQEESVSIAGSVGIPTHCPLYHLLIPGYLASIFITRHPLVRV